MSRWKRFRLWLSFRVRSVADWIRPAITEQEATAAIAAGLANNKKQREFTRRVINDKPNFTNSNLNQNFQPNEEDLGPVDIPSAEQLKELQKNT